MTGVQMFEQSFVKMVEKHPDLTRCQKKLLLDEAGGIARSLLLSLFSLVISGVIEISRIVIVVANVVFAVIADEGCCNMNSVHQRKYVL